MSVTTKIQKKFAGVNKQLDVLSSGCLFFYGLIIQLLYAILLLKRAYAQ